MSQLQQLYRLQQIDSEIQEKKGRLQEVLDAQKRTEPLLAARAALADAEMALESVKMRQREFEQELALLNEKATRSEKRLYSGKVGNPKELTDLQHEIGALGRRRGELEDRVLEAMVMGEERLEAADQASSSLQEIESAWQSRLVQLQGKQNELALRLNELLLQRQEAAALINDQVLATYQATRQRRGGVAVAGLKGDVCQQCRVRSSGSKVRSAQSGEITYCGSCGRILAPV